MSFEWIKFIDVANKLLENKSEESIRSAISRAYYAAFNESRDYAEIEILKKALGNTDVHNKVIRTLKKAKDPFVREVGRDLDRVRNHRVDSDYESETEIKEPTATTCISYAGKIIKTLESRTPYTPFK